jgi:hypothetical protein
MKCPHLPGMTGLPNCKPALVGLLVSLALALGQVAQAAPKPTASGTQAVKTAAKTPAKTSTQARTKTRAKTKSSKSGKAVGKTTSKAPSKRNRTSTRAGKSSSTSSKAKAATAAPAAVAGTAAAAATQDETPVSGIHLPLMLRSTPSLPDNPAALQARLDSLLAAQGKAAQGAQVSGVRQLGPDIYAFSLQCADAVQCQRLRMVIEEQREWVAGLQLDERRNIPKPPERSAPAAR